MTELARERWNIIVNFGYRQNSLCKHGKIEVKETNSGVENSGWKSQGGNSRAASVRSLPSKNQSFLSLVYTATADHNNLIRAHTCPSCWCDGRPRGGVRVHRGSVGDGLGQQDHVVELTIGARRLALLDALLATGMNLHDTSCIRCASEDVKWLKPCMTYQSSYSDV